MLRIHATRCNLAWRLRAEATWGKCHYSFIDLRSALFLSWTLRDDMVEPVHPTSGVMDITSRSPRESWLNHCVNVTRVSGSHLSKALSILHKAQIRACLDCASPNINPVPYPRG